MGAATSFRAHDIRATFFVVAIVTAAVAGCAQQGARVAPSGALPPAAFPEAYYRETAARGQPVFEVDPAATQVVIEVRRAGTLAQLGHDHVIASHDLRGYIAPGERRADLYLPLDRLAVDEPALRAEVGFDGQPPEAAISGTRENMLARFHVEQFPQALIAVRDMETEASGARLEVSIALNGITRTLRVPARVDTQADAMRVAGRLEIEQTAFGIAPYSILGGALQVQDTVAIRFDIRARRWRG